MFEVTNVSTNTLSFVGIQKVADSKVLSVLISTSIYMNFNFHKKLAFA